MKTIIAGSRDIIDLNLVSLAIQESGFTITEVVSGRAPGVDSLGEYWAVKAGLPVKPFPAKWADLNAPGAVVKVRRDGVKYNARAGIDRNHAMGDYAEALIAVWDGKSSGTKDMIGYAKRKGLKVFVKIVETSSPCPSCRPAHK